MNILKKIDSKMTQMATALQMAKADIHTKASGETESFSSRKARSSDRTLVTDVSLGVFRYALVNRKRKKLDLESFGELPKESFRLDSAEHIDSRFDTQNLLRDIHRAGLSWLEKNCSLSYCKILVVSSDIDFFVRRLELPPLKRGELLDVAAWEVNKRIPISVGESYLVVRRDKDQSDFSTVTVGAAPRWQIDRWEYLGEHLAGVIPTAVSLVPLGPKSVSTEAVYCYVYKTNSEINIGFYNSEGLQYSCTAPAISTRYEVGMPESGAGSARIVEELTNSIEVLYSHFPGMKVEGIVLLMPPEELPELSRAIIEQVEIGIISVDPYAGMSRDSQELWKEAGPEYLPLLGAVLTGKEDFRFFPQSIKESIKKKRINKLIRYALFFGIFIEIIAASLWIKDAAWTKSELAHLQALKTEIESSDAYLQSVEYQSRARFLTALADQFASRSDEYSRLLKIFSNITPNGIYLENVSAVKREGKLHLNIAGYYDGDLSKTDVAMMNFMEGLKSGGVGQLKLQRLGPKLSGDRKTESFVLEGRW